MKTRPLAPLWLLLLGMCAACTQAPPRPVAVGRVHRAFVDPERPAWKGGGPRPLAATVWYPARAGSEESEWTAGVFRFGRSALGAPPADGGPRPLVVLSHGTGGSAAQLSWLAEALVAEGFIVAAVNHHGNTAVEPAPSPHGFILPWERARDLSVLVDRLLADPELGPRIAPGRIGAAGFSLGGYTVMASAGARLVYEDFERHCAPQPAAPECHLPPEAHFTLQDVDALERTDPVFQASVARSHAQRPEPRIRAVYAIAPALMTFIEGPAFAGVQAPVRVVLGDQDDQVLAAPTAAQLGRFLPRADVTRLPDAGHYSFLAPCSWRGRLFAKALCADPEGVDRQALHARTAADAARFFRAHL